MNDAEGAFMGNAGHELAHAADNKNLQMHMRNFKLGEKNDVENYPGGPEDVENDYIKTGPSLKDIIESFYFYLIEYEALFDFNISTWNKLPFVFASQ
ncbi:MAG: hypothetical protein WDO16_26020 [Bacteroidota bacterium]